MDSTYLIDEFVTVKPGAPFRLFPFGKVIKNGKAHDITPELAAQFKLPHFKPPIKLGSHRDETPAGGHIIGLEIRNDGLYAIPELNENGTSALDQGAYRYQSPEVIWPGGGYEDPQTGQTIEGPLIVGAALLHTPHLGEAAALYSVEPINQEVHSMSEMVQVPESFWSKVMARLFPEPEDTPPEPAPQVETEQFAALTKERDELKAEIDALKAEQVKQARIDKFTAELKETKADQEGMVEILATLPDEQAAKVLQQFKALSAQIKESNLTGEIGSDGDGEDPDPKGAFVAAIKEKQEAGLSYDAAVQAASAERPELAAAYFSKKEVK